jgi:hypothetical protein
MKEYTYLLSFYDSIETPPKDDKEVLIQLSNGQFVIGYYDRKYKIWNSLREVEKYWKLEDSVWSELPQ